MTKVITLSGVTGPHQNQPVLHVGEPLDKAHAAMIMAHGRGAGAEDILTLVPELVQEGFAFLAPQAAHSTWYPNSFLAPLASNEPWLTSALSVFTSLLTHVQAAGIPQERTFLLGFSQGACLSLEYIARNTQRYGGVAALSGGLIGPDDTPRDYTGTLAGTPVFLGCSDIDFHIPKERVQQSADILQRLEATVTARLYPRMGHTINQDEIDVVRDMMTKIA